MKSIFVLAGIVCSVAAYSQDTKTIRSIDSLVKVLKGSKYKMLRDTIQGNMGKLNLSRRVYLTVMVNDTELKIYTEDVLYTPTEDKKASKTHQVSTYYFDHNKLIKVEQYRADWIDTANSDWYFANGKPLYNTSKQRYRDQYALTMLDEASRMVQDLGFK